MFWNLPTAALEGTPLPAQASALVKGRTLSPTPEPLLPPPTPSPLLWGHCDPHRADLGRHPKSDLRPPTLGTAYEAGGRGWAHAAPRQPSPVTPAARLLLRTEAQTWPARSWSRPSSSELRGEPLPSPNTPRPSLHLGILGSFHHIDHRQADRAAADSPSPRGAWDGLSFWGQEWAKGQLGLRRPP